MAEYACWVVTIYRLTVFIAALLSELYCKVWCNLALLFWARGNRGRENIWHSIILSAKLLLPSVTSRAFTWFSPDNLIFWSGDNTCVKLSINAPFKDWLCSFGTTPAILSDNGALVSYWSDLRVSKQGSDDLLKSPESPKSLLKSPKSPLKSPKSPPKSLLNLLKSGLMV